VRRWLTWLATALLLVAGTASAALVSELRHSEHNGNLRLVLESQIPLRYQLTQLAQPHRWVIDLPTAQLPPALQQQLVALADNSNLVTAVRVAARGDGWRLVLESAQPLALVAAQLPASEASGSRSVFDLSATAVANRTLAEVVGKRRRDIVVAIDAGHGGRDPGALGPYNIQEKQVTFAIAKQLAAIVDASPGFKSYLVRSGDEFIPLRQRSAAARAQRADLFISIHADAFTNPQAHGASVYALSVNGASSEAASFLAERENNADLIGGVDPLNIQQREESVANLLVDLSRDYTLRSSGEIGEQVLSELGSVARLHKKKVEKAAFIVLKSLDMPSLLIETGFISNPQEAKRLSDKRYQRRMAQAIFNGIYRYYLANPPPDSYLADPQALRVHIVQRGDTLSEIAARYNVSQSALRARNKLSSSAIKIGQKLLIPTAAGD